MQKKKLSSIIKSEYLKSIIYPLVIIEAMLLMAYFWSNNYVNSAVQNALINETKVNIKEISNRSASIINYEFKSITDVTELFRIRHEEFFNHYDEQTVSSDSSYVLTSDGVITNHKKSPKACTLFYSNLSKNNPKRMNKAIATQELDSYYNDILLTNNNIVQVYFNSYDSMNRICPFMDNALSQYPHNINIPSYNFYYLAERKYNKHGGVVWTDAYLDPAGQGWMISAIAPVYNKDFLEGVVGIDITLDKILHNILSIKLPYTSYAMLVDQKGNILAMNNGLEPLLGIHELTSHKYNKPIEETISKPKDFNLFDGHKNLFTQKLAEIVAHNDVVVDIDQKKNQFLVTQNFIHETGWKLLILVDKDSVLANTNKLKYKTDKIGYSILALMVLFYVLFFILIVRRSKKFAKIILNPIENLVSATNHLKRNLQIVDIQEFNINEIDILRTNFTTMGKELISLYTQMQSKIEDGIKKNEETQKIMVYQSRLAAMGEMINMIAHQWRQPITAISIGATNMLIDAEVGTVDIAILKQTMEEITNQTDELSKTIDDFRNFFKPEKYAENSAIETIFNDVLTVIGKLLEHNNIKITFTSPASLKITTYSRELMQVIINIIKNAKDAFDTGTNSDKTIAVMITKNTDDFYFLIEDNAGGIAEDVIDKIFEPYFSTKDEKNGTGLGLYMSKTIVEKHLKGHLFVYNNGKGATFGLRLPYSI